MRSPFRRTAAARPAFTLIELLVTVAIIGILIAILLPSLGAARKQARAVYCLTNFRTLGIGIAIYANDHQDVMPPGRLPNLGACESSAQINGGRKYRPTFIAIMSRSVNLPPFNDPQACKNTVDRDGEAGDRQNYASSLYVCPETPEWVDERNGSYGYNYQFLGNSRIREGGGPEDYKNWPVRSVEIRTPAATVAAGDCMGTAASFAPAQRLPYEDNGRNAQDYGDEGFNLDPPWVDVANGEMAGFDSSPQLRTAVDPRHRGRGAIMWVDGHATTETLEALGYRTRPDGAIDFLGENVLWSGTGRDVPWTNDYRP